MYRNNTIFLVGRNLKDENLTVLEVNELPLALINLMQVQSLQANDLEFFKENYITLLTKIIDGDIEYFAILDPKISNYYDNHLDEVPRIKDVSSYEDVRELVNNVNILDGSANDYNLGSEIFIKKKRGCSI